jgi:hypothetical protein
MTAEILLSIGQGSTRLVSFSRTVKGSSSSKPPARLTAVKCRGACSKVIEPTVFLRRISPRDDDVLSGPEFPS